MKTFFAHSMMAGLLLFFPLAHVLAAPNKIDEGNALYEKGQWDQALDTYLQTVGQGFEGPELFYDIGNAYYRKGDRGKAILWYERALRLKPRDADIAFNLQLARSHLKDGGRSLSDQIVFFFTDGEIGGTFLVFLWVTFLLLFARTVGWAPDSSGISALLGVGLTLLIVSGSWFGFRSWQESQPQAVVTAPPGEVRNGPGEDYPVGFTVPEGTRIMILNKRIGWWQVGVPDQGLKGWMPIGQAEEINWRTIS